ncbi:MAG: hypothetical protein KGO02_18885 [Alphaproteobacteria bacterium]|nr:hypothetical protein [Alphaproteobacteria bacterium]
MHRSSKTNHVTLRTDGTDAANLATLADAARSTGRPFVQRSAIIRAALAFAASNITAFSATCL